MCIVGNMHQVREFLEQFTALVLWESSKIGIVTEIYLTEAILNRNETIQEMGRDTKC